MRTTTVILCATGWYDRDTWSSPLLMHFCGEETTGEGPAGGRGRAWCRGVQRGGERQGRRLSYKDATITVTGRETRENS